MTIRRMTCTVCNKEDQPAKYKCPTCRIPYCSVSCCKQHKLEVCDNQDRNDQLNKKVNGVRYLYPTENTLPVEKLHLLRQNKKLKDILGNPHLRTIMEGVNSSGNPTNLIHEAMLEPIFVELVDECLKVVQDPEEF